MLHPCSAFWHEQGNQHINTTTHQTLYGRGLRAALPGPALVLTPPPILGRQADRGLWAAPRANEASEGEAGRAPGAEPQPLLPPD